jgi:transposase
MAAELSGYVGELGEKGRHGILMDIGSRKEFLEDSAPRVRFVYTPKHGSWLNQVEIWFGVLSRKILKRGNFISREDLEPKIRGFIDYFNRTMAKAYKWTYKGLPLTG